MKTINNPLYPNMVEHEGTFFFYRKDPADGAVIWGKLADSCFSLVEGEESIKLTDLLSRGFADG